jgi:glycogen debranching enzyme
VIKEGEPFFVCPPNGQIPSGTDHGFGLYHHDTRFLNHYEFEIADVVAHPLAAGASGGLGVIELTTPQLDVDGTRIEKDQLAIHWARRLEHDPPGLRDRFTLRNYQDGEARVVLRFRFGAAFEDVFLVRGLLDERAGKLHRPQWDTDSLVFGYDGHDGVTRRLRISPGSPPLSRDDRGFEIRLDVPGRGEAHLDIDLRIEEQLRPGAVPFERRTAAPERTGRPARSSAPGSGSSWPTSVVTESLALQEVIDRSLDDLLTLRGELDGQRYYAAGVPWFSTLFGRDSLISAYQTLAFDSAVAEETVRLLAWRQGRQRDEFREEAPGRILHELRIGELARLHEIPQTPYFGSVDATPLFLALLARHARWTGSLDLFRELRERVEAALSWIDDDGDITGAGFLSYGSPDGGALANQGWKDSGNAIVTETGAIAEPPITLPEVQGYVYVAKTAIAELFERDGDARRASALRDEAAALRTRFEHAFWDDELGCYVLALQAGGRPCRVATSNAGQVLWSGISSEAHARSVAHRLLADDLFAGWGIRTLSSEARAYNPIGYHLGTVWPHDNGLIAEGFRRYGLDDEADRLFAGLVEAATDFPDQRLPECFAGFGRDAFASPVRYPVACHPQAWAAGAVPHLLTACLGLLPNGFEGRLRVVRPRLPRFVDALEVRGLRVGSGSVDLAFQRDGGVTRATARNTSGGLEVAIED